MNQETESNTTEQRLSRAPLLRTETTPVIAYRTFGNPEDPAVVLLHSLTTDHMSWEQTASYLLDAGLFLILPDARGHGASDRTGVAKPGDWSADVLRVLDRLGLERCALVGVSMGGIAAIATAAAAPTRVRGIVVADSFLVLEEEVALARIQGMTDYATHHSMRAVADQYLRDTFAESVPSGAQEPVHRAISEMEPADYTAAVRSCFTANVSAEADAVVCPVLVLWGSEDAKTPLECSQAIAQSLTRSRFREIPGAGHLSHMDSPMAFSTAVTDFIMDLPR